MSSKFCTVRAAPGKGEGMFATKNIPAGTTILKDRAVMHLQQLPGRQLTAQQIQEALSYLSEKDQKKFFQLHEGSRALETKIQRIYKANAFGDRSAAQVLCLDISKLNHSCVPNAEQCEGADDKERLLVALKDIKKGEEIYICM